MLVLPYPPRPGKAHVINIACTYCERRVGHSLLRELLAHQTYYGSSQCFGACKSVVCVDCGSLRDFQMVWEWAEFPNTYMYMLLLPVCVDLWYTQNTNMRSMYLDRGALEDS